MQELKENKVYATNQVTDELVNQVESLLERYDDVEVNFDVMGRTLHHSLSHQLYARLNQYLYGADISYAYYQCRIYRRACIKVLTVEVKYRDRNGKELVCYIRRGFTDVDEMDIFMKDMLQRVPNMKHLLMDLYVDGDTFLGYGDISVDAVVIN